VVGEQADVLTGCPNCGEPNPARARFCLNCGRPLPRLEAARQAPPSGTRKLVTVVFSDLTGSTALGERLDPEALSRLLGRWYAVATGVMERHSGTVQKFAGDAVMAVFGIPVAHEDDAVRAVRAAAGLHEGLAELNEELRATYGVELELHTGVNTGQVLTGNPDLGDALVVGDAVNVAARLEQAAEPGTILLGRSTWRLVRDAVTAERVPPLELRGKRGPTEAWRLVSVDPDAPGRARRQDAAFVGRDDELAVLTGAADRVAAGEGPHTVKLLGGAGVGKTRLVAETLAGLAGVAVLHGRCLPYGDGITMWPLAEVVRQAAGIGPGDAAGPARAKLTGLLAGAPDGVRVAERLGRLIGLDQAAAPIQEAAWAAGRLVAVLAAARPLVLVFDDLHWAEPGFLETLDRLPAELGGAPVLLVELARPEVLEARPDWAGAGPGTTVLELDPLGGADARALLDELAAPAALPAEAAERITGVAEGNPLFLEELLASLVEDGRLERDGEQWRVAGDLDRAGPPPTVQALLGARLDRLDPSDRDLLERAAVTGEVFELAMLVELTGPQERAGLPERLAGLARREFLRPAPARLAAEGGWRFRHVVVRDAVYDRMPKQTRTRLHQQVAALVEARAGERAREYGEIIGYHLEQATRWQAELGQRDTLLSRRASGWLAQAGRRALAGGDLPAGTSLLERADVLAPGDGRLLGDLAEALVAAGAFDRAGVALDRAEASAGDDPGLAAGVGVARLHLRIETEPEVELDELRPQVAAAIATLTELGDEQGLARAWRLAGYERFVACRITEAEEAVRRSVDHAARAGDGRLEAYGTGLLAAAAYWGPLPAAEGVARCRAILAEADGNRYLQTSTLQVLGACLAMLGHVAEAREQAALGLAVAAELGGNRLTAIAGQFAAAVELLAGEPAAAEAILLPGYRDLERVGDTGARSNLAADLAWACALQGRGDEAAGYVEVSARLAARQDLYAQVRWRLALVRVLAGGSEAARAATLAAEAVELAERTDMTNLHADALVELARTQEAETAFITLSAAQTRYRAKGNLAAATGLADRRTA
jgi:class 3 adenylate cyclase